MKKRILRSIRRVAIAGRCCYDDAHGGGITGGGLRIALLCQRLLWQPGNARIVAAARPARHVAPVRPAVRPLGRVVIADEWGMLPNPPWGCHGVEPLISASNPKNPRLRCELMFQLTGTLW